MQLSHKELSEIIEKDLPGYSLDQQDESEEERDSVDAYSRSYVQAEGHTPDLQTLHSKYSRHTFGGDAVEPVTDFDHLRSKYLGNDADAEVDSVADSFEADEGRDNNTTEDLIVPVSRKSAAHPLDRGARPKAAVISGSEKKVIGQQG